MIKARATGKDGKPIFILGLSRGNTDLLLQGKPIAIDSSMYGIPNGPHIFILGGETEAAIQAELAKHLTLPEPQPDPVPEPLSAQEQARRDCPACTYGDCGDPAHGW
jgi:hypothetical protein